MQEQKSETVLLSEWDRPTYEYSGGGVVRKNGVEMPIASLSESERVTVGEEILRQTSERTGTPVSELRKLVSGYASGALNTASLTTGKGGGIELHIRKSGPEFARMLTADGKPALVHQGQNRKARRTKSTLKRRAARAR